MFIRKFICKGYIYFQDIREIEIDFTSPIQIIIGDNGSGKSSLLHSVNPYPAMKSDYVKHGFKQIIMEHNQSLFVLTSDFSKKNTHSFVKDGEELNESGTSTVQNELVVSELGYTQLVHNVIYNKPMCTTPKPDRKNWLMSINPIDFSFILDFHKKTCSKIREIKNNLTLLNTRKVEIEHKLITKEEYELQQAGKLELEEHNRQLELVILMLESEKKKNIDLTKLQGLKAEANALSKQFPVGLPNDPNSININCTHVLHTLTELSHVDRSKDINMHISNLQTKLQGNKEQQRDMVSLIQEQLTDIETYENYAKLADKKSTRNELHTKLLEIRTHIEEDPVKLDKISSYLPKEVLASFDFDSFGKTLSQRCVEFNEGKGTPLIPSKTSNKLLKKSHSIREKTYLFQTQINNVKILINTETAKFQDLDVLKPYSECTVGAALCSFKQDYLSKEVQRSSLTKSIKTQYARLDVLQQKSVKYEKVYEKLMLMYNTQQQYYQQLNVIYDSLEPWMWQVVDKSQFLMLMDRQPFALFQQLTHYWALSEIANSLVERHNLCTELEAQIKQLDETELPAQEVITKLLQQRKTSYNKYRKKLDILESGMSSIETDITDYTTYGRIKQQMLNLKECVNKHIAIHMYSRSSEFYSELITFFKIEKYHTQESLRGYDTILKEQQGYLTRYNDEILPLIASLETEKNNYELMEKALSPTSGIPFRYLSRYLNPLINNINHFINRVWTFDFNLLPIDEQTSSMDFNFPYLINGKLSSDIVNCSDGQQNIMNFVWTLAIMIHMKLYPNYPLYLDEPDRGLDELHRQKFLELLNDLVETGYISQLFLINHYAPLSSGFLRSQTLCLSDENINTPLVYNQHATITK